MGSVEHSSRLGVMVETLRTPVIHQHCKIKVIRLHNQSISIGEILGSYPSLDMLACVHYFSNAVVDRER